MSRLEPKNREEAFTYQFEDDVKMLRTVAMLGEKEFKKALTTLEIHIKAYRSKLLIRAHKKAVQKTKERDSWMKKYNPSLYKLMNKRAGKIKVSARFINTKPLRTKKQNA